MWTREISNFPMCRLASTAQVSPGELVSSPTISTLVPLAHLGFFVMHSADTTRYATSRALDGVALCEWTPPQCSNTDWHSDWSNMRWGQEICCPS
ncbi:hypothetical protein TNIN_441991 [Trichonephila inaurata madagascariensis]|uniref:Uncharacterized protein n=1 Tax=Trichonephila inaurata madagascariensis TaxID=2747483 RepID=A0A8X6XE45_9ARAC|nr:hypothetical protein TNIN_441991 [Trichonephila inaurata madagascariensis]